VAARARPRPLPPRLTGASARARTARLGAVRRAFGGRLSLGRLLAQRLVVEPQRVGDSPERLEGRLGLRQLLGGRVGVGAARGGRAAARGGRPLGRAG
jgi:hypothetical protein